MLAEPYLEGVFTKWNSNSGYVDDYNASVQAFCHWSYDYSNGEYLMCDAQGVRCEKVYKITDPCIVSNGQGGIYGIADCGIKSIYCFSLEFACFLRYN